jgi:hypothetical protein
LSFKQVAEILNVVDQTFVASLARAMATRR